MAEVTRYKKKKGNTCISDVGADIRSFDEVGNNAHAWRASADELLATANVLKRQRDAVQSAQLKTGDQPC